MWNPVLLYTPGQGWGKPLGRERHSWWWEQTFARCSIELLPRRDSEAWLALGWLNRLQAMGKGNHNNEALPGTSIFWTPGCQLSLLASLCLLLGVHNSDPALDGPWTVYHFCPRTSRRTCRRCWSGDQALKTIDQRARRGQLWSEPFDRCGQEQVTKASLLKETITHKNPWRDLGLTNRRCVGLASHNALLCARYCWGMFKVCYICLCYGIFI